MWASTSSGRIELHMTRAQAAGASHSGSCDSDVLALSHVPEIHRQLAKLDPVVLRAELHEYGAWDIDELLDHNQNLQRILWILANDITERD